MDRALRVLLVGLCAAVLMVTAAPVGATVNGDPPVSAQGIHLVTNGDDSGTGSFRETVTDANTDAGPVTIIFIPGLTVTLTTGQVTYTNDQPIAIQGNGSTIDRTTVASRILEVTDVNAALTVDGLTFTNGDAAGVGGAIFTIGAVTATNSTFSNNTATGVGGSGGAILGGGGGVTAVNSTFTDNTAGGDGGAIRTSGTGTVTATNSTFTDNDASGDGGAIFGNGDDVSLVYATIVDNSAPTVANVHSSGTLSSFGSVLAGPMGGGDNCEVTGATTSTYSYSTDDSCGFTGTGDTEDGADPQLDPLASNGGATQTRAPATTSPLVDAIPEADCDPTVTTDQRGVDRPQGPGCDIGAVELVPAPPPTTAPTACPATAAQAGLLPVGATPDATGWLLLAAGGLLVAPVVWRSRAGRARVRRHRPTSMRARHTRIRAQLLWLIATLAMIAVFVACQPVKKFPPCPV